MIKITDKGVYDNEDLNWTTASDWVVLNCNGATITDGSWAIKIHDKEYIAIINCIINSSSGILVTGTENAYEFLNNVFDVDEKAIRLDAGVGGGNYIKDNIIMNSNEEAIYFNGNSTDAPGNSLIQRNEFLNNKYGLYLKYSYNNQIYDNDFKDNNFSIYLKANGESFYTRIKYNNISENLHYGIYINNQANIKINNNSFCDSSLDYDIFATHYYGNNVGDGNKCDKPYSGWNDSGTTGCTYPCQTPPTAPTSILCGGGDCTNNQSFVDTMIISCSGSTDYESDVLTYFIDAYYNMLEKSSINYFNNDLTEENLTFTGDANTTRYLEIPRHANITSAYLNLSGYSSPIKYEYYDTEDDSHAGINEREWMGQSFTVGTIGEDEEFNIVKIRLKMVRRETPETVTVSITAVDGNGKPTGADLSTGTINGSTFTIDTNGEWYEIIMSSYTLQESTQYAIVIKALEAVSGSGNEILIRFDGTSSSYTGGKRLYYNGDDWNTYASADLMFEIFGGSSAYPSNLYLEIGTPDGNYEWNYTGTFNETVSPIKTADLSSAINSALNNGACDCADCSLNQDNCTIGFLFHSDSAGELGYTNMNITYHYLWKNIGNHSQDSYLTWDMTGIAKQSGVDLKCRAVDLLGTNNYSDYYESNSNLTINSDTSPIVTLISPAYESVDEDGIITFNCSAIDNSQLVNITLYGNWTGSWHVNETKSLSGESNSTIFTKTLSEGLYIWNCLAYDNASQFDFEDINYTVSVPDITPPNITEVITINVSGVVDGNVIQGENLSFNVTVTDNIAVESVWLKIWAGAIGISNIIWQGFLSFVTGDLWSVIVETNESFPVGEVNYTVYANDSIGNEINFSSNFAIVLPNDTSKFYLKDNLGENVAWLGNEGNIVLSGNCFSGGNCNTPGNDSFIIGNSTDDYTAFINSTGDMCVEKGDCSDQSASCNPTRDAFIIRNSSDYNMSYIDFDGDLCLTGGLYENADL